MSPAKRDVLIAVVICAVVAVFIWIDSKPGSQVPLGIASIALALSTLVLPLIRKPAADTPEMPVVQKMGLAASLILIGISKIWPSHDMTMAAVLCMLVPQLPRILRS